MKYTNYSIIIFL